VTHSTLKFIAVATPPPDENGGAIVKQVLATARNSHRLMKGYKKVVIKNTVPAGTADKVRAAIASEIVKRGSHAKFVAVPSPELLNEGAPVNDFMRTDRVIDSVDDQQFILLMRALHAPSSATTTSCRPKLRPNRVASCGLMADRSHKITQRVFLRPHAQQIRKMCNQDKNQTDW
jgi:UDP-glucose 6-dehydrogenase